MFWFNTDLFLYIILHNNQRMSRGVIITPSITLCHMDYCVQKPKIKLHLGAFGNNSLLSQMMTNIVQSQPNIEIPSWGSRQNYKNFYDHTTYHKWEYLENYDRYKKIIRLFFFELFVLIQCWHLYICYWTKITFK